MIESREDLDAIKQACHSMVTRSSGLSAGAAIIPIPGVDLGSDVAILMRLIPRINEKFGLSPEQIESLDTESKLFVMTAISNTGSKLAGKYITKKLIVTVLNKMGIKVAAKGVTKFVPLIGSAVAGSISFTATKVMGNYRRWHLRGPRRQGHTTVAGSKSAACTPGRLAAGPACLPNSESRTATVRRSGVAMAPEHSSGPGTALGG